MYAEVILFSLILLLGLILFFREIFPLEISALLLMLLLVFTDILSPSEAFSSFGNQSIVLIGSLFVMIAGLNKTGLIKKLENTLLKVAGKNRNLTFTVLLMLIALFSAFVSNTATLAISIPIAVSIAKSFGESPKKWLMPIAFASLLGGMNTLVGTSTNIIISELLPHYGLEHFNLFTTSHVGLPILVGGIIYLVLISRYLIPVSESDKAESVEIKYNLRSYTAEVKILSDSPLCERTIADANLFQEVDIIVLQVNRPGYPPITPRASFILREGDTLLVEGNIDKLTEFTGKYRLKFVEELKSEKDTKENRRSKEQQQLEFYEVLVTARSILHNRTAAEVHLRNRYRLSLIAINRQGVTVHQELSSVRINAGDILVVQPLNELDPGIFDFLGLVPLQELKQDRYRKRRAIRAALIFIAALATGALTEIPLAVTCLAGAVLMVITNILIPQEIYQAIEWRILIFIGAILSLGKAIETSGTAAFLAGYLSEYLIHFSPAYILAFFFISTVLITQMISNQATAVVMIPLAINTAQAIGLKPMPLVMSVTIAASCCFMTPFEPVCMLVYGPGGYRFSDFIRVGLLLTLFALICVVLTVPLWWPF
ncbi:MAG: hypothetical protein D6719_11845 [Candidatus Dadabacteria bacterium]|nr:MAG: hypothetical protein D6719_11845 [Candidatus Dadabacteria bacterium]